MNIFASQSGSRRRAFTLVEIMISTGLISIIMLLLVSTIDQTQRVWKRTTEKTTQFQGARGAFESMNRRLSQATLNTYWRAHEDNTNTDQSDFLFRRQSELQFISGPTQRFFASSPQLINLSSPVDKAYPGHAMFFQAPLGFTEEQPVKGTSDSDKYNAPRYRNLDNLLTACGYFVEYGPETDRPDFLSQMSPPPSPKYRFRLMEMTVPTEHLQVYYRPKDDDGYADPRIFDRSKNYYVGMTDSKRRSNPGWARPLWMEEAFLREKVTGAKIDRFRYAHVRADNIVGMVILPKLAEKDRTVPGSPKSHDPKQLALAPEYEFDSWRILSGGTVNSYGSTTIKFDNTARDNLLPPIIQVTMIAVDESAMVRANASETNIPSWMHDLFVKVTTVDDYMDDVKELEKRLLEDPNKPNYRIFSADVLLRASKWSRDPQDKAN